MKRRAYQQEALKGVVRYRLCAWLWERQAGKSTNLGDVALFEMMREPGRTVVYGSASLLLAREIILKQQWRADISVRDLVEKESRILQEASARFAAEATAAEMRFETADAKTGKGLPASRPDDFTELFESSRLEFRVWHDQTRYSRTQVIAPNVATARGWSGTVLLDEIAFIRDFKELFTAVEPIISTNPAFRMILSTTPPQDDDTHFCFELLAPPAGLEFPVNPAGNWYESELGIQVHRADALDTHAAGKRIYDVKTGREITPEEAFKRAVNKDGYRINHRLQFLSGGAAACDLLRLKVAQERGIGRCACFVIDSDQDFQQALSWITSHMDSGQRTGLGFDVATTTKQKSNPSVLSVVQEDGPDFVFPGVMVWKVRDPDVAEERVRETIRRVKAVTGGFPRALAIDATNEKYFAEGMQKRLRSMLPVLQVVASEGVDAPGLEKATNWKEFLGDQYVSLLEDNHLVLPPEVYLRADHRLVLKDRGRFVCEPDEEGRHGDTFDGNKLAIHALTQRVAPGRPVAATGGRRGHAIAQRQDRSLPG